MTPENDTGISPMDRVRLSVEAGTAEDRSDLSDGPFPLDFVFGIGTEGLTPFEFELARAAVGGTIRMTVQRENAHSFFRHLAPRLMQWLHPPQTLFLTVRVEEAQPAESREILREMADAGACGHDGGCGCGCC